MNTRTLPWALLLAVFCATLIPRLLLLGGPPATDEGIYAYNAMMIYRNPPPGGLLPDFGTLNLYPALLSWVYAFDLNHFVLLRLADAVVAALAGVMLYRVLTLESGSRMAGALIAVGFLLTMNDPVFIQYGFKNSIAAASLPLLAAIWLGLHTQPINSKAWFWSGVLVALAVLLREPLVVLALAGTAAVLVRGGWRGAAAYAAGGIAASTAVLLAVIIMRGGAGSLLQSYVDAGQMYQGIAYQRQALLLSSPITFAANAAGALLVAGVMTALLAGMMLRSGQASIGPRLLFWLALALLPLLEPLLKNGYPYHYATSLIGLAGVTTLGWHAMGHWRPQQRGWLAAVLIMLIFVSLLPKLVKLADIHTRYPVALANWPATTLRQSNYLLIAEKIRNQAEADATLAINGSMLGVIPLAGLRPARPDLAHLSYQYLYTGNDPQRLRSLLYECPPDFIMLTGSSPFRDTRALFTVVRNMPEYVPAGYVPPSNASYGSFDGAIFKWQPAVNPCRRPVTEE